MALPTIHLTGTLTADAVTRFTHSGIPVSNFRLACNERRKDSNGQWETVSTIYLDVITWRNAEALAALTKGTRVMVRGTLRQRTYTGKDGNERVTIEVDAEEIAPVIASQTPFGASKSDVDNGANPYDSAPF